MKKNITKLLLLLCLALFGASVAHAEKQGYWSWFFSFKRMKEVAPITDAVYEEECGSCHFAYQPGWLPEASWHKLMDAKALEDHFKENAELDEQTRKQLLDILVANSADKSRYKRSKKIMASLPEGEAPLRITEVPYIKSKHQGVYDDVVSKSKKVKSLSYCDKCHQKAKEADFDDDTVYIPGHGYNTW
ncbi:hypothetical protein [Kaarinaea lacus]